MDARARWKLHRGIQSGIAIGVSAVVGYYLLPFVVLLLLWAIFDVWGVLTGTDWTLIGIGLLLILSCRLYRRFRPAPLEAFPLAGSVSVLVSLLLFGWLFWTWDLPLDPAAWIGSSGAGRYRMRESVLRMLRDGTIDSRESASKLLGPPSHVWSSPGGDQFKWGYSLGADRFKVISIDSLWLMLEFDREGKVTRHGLTVH